MKLFGWKSAAKAPARPALTRVANWISGDWPRAYEAQLRELYLGWPPAPPALATPSIFRASRTCPATIC